VISKIVFNHRKIKWCPMAKATATDLAKAYIGAATKERNPMVRSQILRRGASRFADLASRQRDPRKAKALTDIGLSFVGESMKMEPTTNDFTQILRDTAQAWADLGPDATDSNATMDAMAVERTNVASAPTTVPNVCVQPSSFNNKDVTLGRVATLTGTPTQTQIQQGIVQSQTVAFWQGAKRESTVISIDFGENATPQPSPQGSGFNYDARLYAQIQYGADGFTASNAIVDVGLGRRISVVGNYVSVVVGMEPSTTAGVNTPVVSVGAALGTFGAVSHAPIIRTVTFSFSQWTATAAPTIWLLPVTLIPQRAVRILPPLGLTPLLTGGTTTGVIEFFGYGGLSISSWPFAFSTPSSMSVAPIPIPGHAYYFVIVVQSATNPAVNVTVPFELSL
jgi:hypothetical protein